MKKNEINNIINWWLYDVLKKPRPTINDIIKAVLILEIGKIALHEIGKIEIDLEKDDVK